MTAQAVSILALNVSAPTRERARGLLELLWPAEDDVWVLTETSGGEGSALIAQVCRAAGHDVHVTDRSQAGGRGVTVVGRGVPLEVEDLPGPAVLPGRVLPVVVGEGAARLRLLGVYGAASDPVRYASSAQRERKRQWLAAWSAWLPTWAVHDPAAPRALVGDLNLVDPHHDDALPYVLAEETAALAALQTEHGLVDAWRREHPGSTEVSWVDHSGAGARFDHAFVTPDLPVVSCELDQAPREAGLTDHAAIRLAVRPG